MASIHSAARATTVRARIIRAVADAVAALPFVGSLEHEGQTQQDPATPAGITADGLAAVVLMVGDDRIEGEQQNALTTKRFAIGLTIALPEGTVARDGGGDPLSPGEIAAEVCARILELYAAEDGDPTWGGLAIDTDELGGGGVGIDPDAYRVFTTHAFEIEYRHWYGDPKRLPSELADANPIGYGGGGGA